MLFDATLDARTCPFCGAMDGKIWSVDALVDVRRPPLHMNCRCCLVPHIDLRDKDGNVLELGERPAANADFDKLAEEQYNADAKAKGLKRRFKDLAQSTRLKYYYQAQKDFEKRTGKPAYRQVSTKTTFKEYFERQPEAFKRAWLGRNRFEAYKNGTLKIDDYLNPNRFYTARVVDLKPATTDSTNVGDGATIKEPVKPTPPPKIESAADFVAAIDNFRRQKYGDETAERLARESEAFAGKTQEFQRLFLVDFQEMKEKRRKADRAYRKSSDTQKDRDKYNAVVAEYDEFVARLNATNAERLNLQAARKVSSDVDDFLDFLFPDLGGAPIFSESEKQRLSKPFRRKGFADAADVVFNRYNKVAKTYALPTDTKTLDVAFAKLGKDTLGEYWDQLQYIKLSGGLDREGIIENFAHELGHWFDQRQFGYWQTNENTEWLLKKTGLSVADCPNGKYGKTVGTDKAPNLCWSYWGYSHTVYPPRTKTDASGNKIAYRSNDIISTAFEALLTDPEAFARQAPEHFNLLLENLKPFKIAKTK